MSCFQKYYARQPFYGSRDFLTFGIEYRYGGENMLKEIDCKLERRSILAFIAYILVYAFILAPYCLIGYISELVNLKKKW